jgi:hypothetical protein
MKIEKISEHHIRFNNGTAIKIAPQSMRIDTTSLSLVPNIKDIDFKEPIAFTESAQRGGFSFGNIGGKMIPVSLFGNGISRECAVYYENKLKLVVEIC